MRIILDVDCLIDAEVCLRLAQEQQRLDPSADYGYWSQRDPDFSAYIRATKTGVSVRGRRRRDSDGSGEAGQTAQHAGPVATARAGGIAPDTRP